MDYIPDRTWGDARNGVSTTGDGALARLAVPDTGSLALDGDLSAEGASVLGVLGDFHLLNLLSQGSTVTSNRYVSFRGPLSLSSRGQIDSARLSRAALGLSYLCPTGVFFWY